MKYLVVKGGILGFGDRLESLKMAVNYAIHNKQVLHLYLVQVNMPSICNEQS
jgi:hypothetical protein